MKKLIRDYHITHLYVENCTQQNCIEIHSAFPTLVIREQLEDWDPNKEFTHNTITQLVPNKALVAMKPGEKGFNAWFQKTYKTQLDRIGNKPFRCTRSKTPTLFPSQEMAIYLSGPRCPAIQNLLAVQVTGAGKTLIGQSFLSLRHTSDMPKIALVPNDAIRNNLYKKLLNNIDSPIGQFCRRVLKLSLDKPLSDAELGKYMKRVKNLLAFKVTGKIPTCSLQNVFERQGKGKIDQPIWQFRLVTWQSTAMRDVWWNLGYVSRSG